ncbi:MAG: hypothetical protein INQ03_01820 [Candidatus Heimdallarchaeota archaeon]|nr:hypothetical protein [Candidatus Heimdallarchaeota archaeon]
MTKEYSQVETLGETVSVLESVNSGISSFYPNDLSKSTFFNDRAEFLQLFTSLAINLHQGNTIRYLRAGELAKQHFKGEINSINAKILEYKEQIVEAIQTSLTKMNQHRILLQNYDNQLRGIVNSLESNSASSIYLTKYIKEDNIRKQSLLFAIEDTRSKILLPTLKICKDEIEAGEKVIEAVSILISQKDNSKFSPDELARFCELLAGGLDGSSDWEDIQQNVQSNELYQELVLLKPHSILETSERKRKTFWEK